MNEISCRVTNTFIQYVNRTRPGILTPLLEGLPFNKSYLMNSDNWISWEIERILEERLVNLYEDEMIMFKIGRSVVRDQSLGIVNILSNLFMTPERFIRYAPKIARYFTKDAVHITVLDTAPQSATLELRIKGKQTKGSCLYNQGLLSVSLEIFGIGSAEISEEQCIVPVDEIGKAGNRFYSIDKDKRVIEHLSLGKKGKCIGHLADDHSFQLNGTRYGAESCIYRLKWEAKSNRFFRKTAGRQKALNEALEHLEENHKKLEDAYERVWHSEAQYRSLMENASDIICIIDANGIITSINKKGIELSGYSSEEIIGQDFLCFVDDADKKEAQKKFMASLDAPAGPLELVIRTKDRSALVISANSSSIRESGNVVGLMIIARDITKESEMTARLLEAERFAAKGMVAAEIAHEINNSLANMETALFIVNNIRTDSRYRQDIFHDVFEEIERMSGIVKGILEVYRSDNTVIQQVNLNTEIAKVIDITRRRLYGKVISIASELSPDLPSVPCYPGHIKQILLNLIKNAEEAMSNSNKKLITISTAEGNGHVRLDVKDTGCGIPKGNLAKVFTQLYTSKSEGSGMGLAICRQIISQYNGTITIKSDDRKGTTVSVTLPTKYHAQYTGS